MANNYTDTYTGISKGADILLGPVVNALNTKEKVANKISAAEWAASKDSDTKYPSCAAIGSAVAAAINSSVVVEKVANRVNSGSWDADKTSDTKYPTCKAVDDAVISSVNSGKITSISASADINSSALPTDAQLPTARAVWNFGKDFKTRMNTSRGNTSSLAANQVTASEFQAVMGYCNGGSGAGAVYEVCWYEAVQYCVYKTLGSSDVAQGVKDHITKYYKMGATGADCDTTSYGATDGGKCVNYLKYALITPKCYRLLTSAEWSTAYNNGTIGHAHPAFGVSNERVFEWVMDASTGSSLTLGGRAFRKGAYDASRALRGGDYYIEYGGSKYLDQFIRADRLYYEDPFDRDTYSVDVTGMHFDTTVGLRLARTE